MTNLGIKHFCRFCGDMICLIIIRMKWTFCNVKCKVNIQLKLSLTIIILVAISIYFDYVISFFTQVPSEYDQKTFQEIVAIYLFLFLSNDFFIVVFDVIHFLLYFDKHTSKYVSTIAIHFNRRLSVILINFNPPRTIDYFVMNLCSWIKRVNRLLYYWRIYWRT